MVRSFRIENQKDQNGYYILPTDVIHGEEMLTSFARHSWIPISVKNTIIAIICSLDRKEVLHINIMGFTDEYVRINGFKVFLDKFYLDEENNILYKADSNDEILTTIRKLKLKKILE